MSEQFLYLGLDLSPEYTQLSAYNLETGEPDSIYHSRSKDTYLHPNILFFGNTIEEVEEGGIDGTFSAGASASERRHKDPGMVVDQLYIKTEYGEEVDVYDATYQASDLLVKMLLLHIEEYTKRFEEFKIVKLVVTVAHDDANIIKAVKRLQGELKLADDEFQVSSHIDAGLHYIFNQPDSLRNNSVALFDFNGEGMDYYRIDISRYKTPEVIDVVHKNLNDRLNYPAVKRNKDELDERFAILAKELMAETYISAVFLTGIGFMEEWMDESTGVLCDGRRVFLGQNIYAKGACYRAVGGTHADALSRYFVNSAYTVPASIGINLKDEKETFLPITKSGVEWFEKTDKLYIFLDETMRLDLLIKHAITGDTTREVMEIHGLPKRPVKTTKLSLETEFTDATHGAVIIRDEGFGEMYPTTNKIYRKEFDLTWEE